MKTFVFVILGSVLFYLMSVYGILPAVWWRHESHAPLEKFSGVTVSKENIPGDPLNVALVGSREEIVHAMGKAGWMPADPLTLQTAAAILKRAILHKPYPEAPVSSLYLFGRKQDLAFELPVGSTPRKRHHVRFWNVPDERVEGRPFWIGAATFDESYGMSHLTGEVTHHIAPDVSAERDFLINTLMQAGQLERKDIMEGIGPVREGKNAEGDRYFTDGKISVGVLRTLSVNQ